MIACTTGGHQNVPAIGEGQLDRFGPRQPYCRSCLLRCVAPVAWWALPVASAIQVVVGGVVVDGTLLMTAIQERLVQHSYPTLDAAERGLVAQVAVDALFEVLAQS